MKKFNKTSFAVVKVTDIPKQCLLEGTLNLLEGRELYKDIEIEENIYSGDVFETISCELFETKKIGILYNTSKEVEEEIENLSEIIETELIRITCI